MNASRDFLGQGSPGWSQMGATSNIFSTDVRQGDENKFYFKKNRPFVDRAKKIMQGVKKSAINPMISTSEMSPQ